MSWNYDFRKFQHSGPFKYPPCGVFHSVVNIPLESDPLELSLSTFIRGRSESCLGHTSIDFELRRATRRAVRDAASCVGGSDRDELSWV